MRIIYKKLGETPLQATERLCRAYPELKKVRLSYAGRLDPMAEGVLIILEGEENKDRLDYITLDKEYEFEFFFGLETDTYDILGIIKSSTEKFTEPDKELIDKALKKYKGEFEQKYPPFSSKVVNGLPLFELAKQGKLAGIELPKHTVFTKIVDLLSSRVLSKAEFENKVFENIGLVTGDFRQEETLKRWKKYFEDTERKEFVLWKAHVACDSGFYVRGLVNDVGVDLGPKATTFHILRKRVGKFRIEDSIM